jgi:hypothetical protein
VGQGERAGDVRVYILLYVAGTGISGPLLSPLSSLLSPLSSLLSPLSSLLSPPSSLLSASEISYILSIS